MGDLDTEFLPTFYSADDYEVGTVLELTVTGSEWTEFEDKKTGEKSRKLALRVSESTQKMKLNNTNGRLYKRLFGANSADWIGKKVKLMVATSGVGPYFAAIEPKPAR